MLWLRKKVEPHCFWYWESIPGSNSRKKLTFRKKTKNMTERPGCFLSLLLDAGPVERADRASASNALVQLRSATRDRWCWTQVVAHLVAITQQSNGDVARLPAQFANKEWWQTSMGRPQGSIAGLSAATWIGLWVWWHLALRLVVTCGLQGT
jgi:hypothetical protein